MSKIPIVFFGSGPVAANALELLLDEFDVVAVVTKPKPDHHKGDSPVIDIANKHNLTLHTVSNKTELSELIIQKPLKTEVAILIDFGIIVTQDVIDYFPKGIINSHFSLLPEWRGADPITFSILSGQKKTGVSLMLIDKGMDTGKLIRQKSYKITSSTTAVSLTDDLISLSNELLKQSIRPYLDNDLKPRNQPHQDRATYSRKLTKADGILDFSKPADILEREIRAFLGWPKSKTTLADIDVIITKASVVNNSGKPGNFTTKDSQLVIYCGQNALLIESIKPAGKSEMSTQAFLAGYGHRL